MLETLNVLLVLVWLDELHAYTLFELPGHARTYPY
jgi:hypothetical protein